MSSAEGLPSTAPSIVLSWHGPKHWLLVKEGCHIILDRCLVKDSLFLTTKVPLYGRLSRVEKRAAILKYASAVLQWEPLVRNIIVDTVSLAIVEACANEGCLEAIQVEAPGKKKRVAFMQKVIGDALAEMLGATATEADQAAIESLQKQRAVSATVTYATTKIRSLWLHTAVASYMTQLAESKTPPSLIFDGEICRLFSTDYFLAPVPAFLVEDERHLQDAIRRDEEEAGKETVFAANLKKALKLVRQGRSERAGSGAGSGGASRSAGAAAGGDDDGATQAVPLGAPGYLDTLDKYLESHKLSADSYFGAASAAAVQEAIASRSLPPLTALSVPNPIMDAIPRASMDSSRAGLPSSAPSISSVASRTGSQHGWWCNIGWADKYCRRGGGVAAVFHRLCASPDAWAKLWRSKDMTGPRLLAATGLDAEETCDVLDHSPLWLSFRGMVGTNLHADGLWPITSNDGNLTLVKFRRNDRTRFWYVDPAAAEPGLLASVWVAWARMATAGLRPEISRLAIRPVGQEAGEGPPAPTVESDEVARAVQRHLEAAILAHITLKVVSACAEVEAEWSSAALGDALVQEEEAKAARQKAKEKEKEEKKAAARRKKAEEEEKRAKAEADAAAAAAEEMRRKEEEAHRKEEEAKRREEVRQAEVAAKAAAALKAAQEKEKKAAPTPATANTAASTQPPKREQASGNSTGVPTGSTTALAAPVGKAASALTSQETKRPSDPVKALASARASGRGPASAASASAAVPPATPSVQAVTPASSTARPSGAVWGTTGGSAPTAAGAAKTPAVVSAAIAPAKAGPGQQVVSGTGAGSLASQAARQGAAPAAAKAAAAQAAQPPTVPPSAAAVQSATAGALGSSAAAAAASTAARSGGISWASLAKGQVPPGGASSSTGAASSPQLGSAKSSFPPNSGLDISFSGLSLSASSISSLDTSFASATAPNQMGVGQGAGMGSLFTPMRPGATGTGAGVGMAPAGINLAGLLGGTDMDGGAGGGRGGSGMPFSEAGMNPLLATSPDRRAGMQGIVPATPLWSPLHGTSGAATGLGVGGGADSLLNDSLLSGAGSAHQGSLNDSLMSSAGSVSASDTSGMLEGLSLLPSLAGINMSMGAMGGMGGMGGSIWGGGLGLSTLGAGAPAGPAGQLAAQAGTSMPATSSGGLFSANAPVFIAGGGAHGPNGPAGAGAGAAMGLGLASVMGAPGMGTGGAAASGGFGMLGLGSQPLGGPSALDPSGRSALDASQGSMQGYGMGMGQGGQGGGAMGRGMGGLMQGAGGALGMPMGLGPGMNGMVGSADGLQSLQGSMHGVLGGMGQRMPQGMQQQGDMNGMRMGQGLQGGGPMPGMPMGPMQGMGGFPAGPGAGAGRGLQGVPNQGVGMPSSGTGQGMQGYGQGK